MIICAKCLPPLQSQFFSTVWDSLWEGVSDRDIECRSISALRWKPHPFLYLFIWPLLNHCFLFAMWLATFILSPWNLHPWSLLKQVFSSSCDMLNGRSCSQEIRLMFKSPYHGEIIMEIFVSVERAASQVQENRTPRWTKKTARTIRVPTQFINLQLRGCSKIT